MPIATSTHSVPECKATSNSAILKYLRAVTNAVNRIWKEQSFATGGWGPNEAFVEPGKGLLGASLTDTNRSFETPCGAYAHFKVMRYLLTLTRDPRYGDSMEKVLYNTVLGAKPIKEDGSSFYYSNYQHAAHKTYRLPIADSPYRWDHDARWPCCSGTLPQIAADYLISTYFQSSDGIYINLYVPSILRANSLTLTQKTNYPRENHSKFTVSAATPIEKTFYFRIPAWAGKSSSLSVNGKRVTTELQSSSFAPLKRTWRNGDRIELDIQQPVTLQPVDPQTPNQVAIVKGPQVLFAIAETQPTITSDFKLTDLTLRPFTEINDERIKRIKLKS